MMLRVSALTFHDVTAEGQTAAKEGDSFYRISSSEFEQLLGRLRQLGYQSVSSRVFRAWQQGKGKLPEKPIVLTFDDGYASHFEVVAPLLLRYRFFGTFFVTSDRIGQPGYMSWEQLKKLVFLGMEIGSHGKTHRPLTEHDPAVLEEELTVSQKKLEEQLGVPVRAIAAPGGFWNSRVAQMVLKSGYEAAWISTIGTNGQDTQPLALRRLPVHQPFSADRIIAMTQGTGLALWMASRQQSMIRLLKRILGVYWYEQLKRRLIPNA